MVRSHIRRRITVDLDDTLLSAVDARAGLVRESRNQFVVAALADRLRTLERLAVDEAFATMADDPAYRAEAAAVDAQMRAASDAAWRTLDRPAADVPDRPQAKRRRRRAAR
jgi:metal-responsive CopG/Arc/MetJ family transcriptional regulator